jgi:hypothetical protein
MHIPAAVARVADELGRVIEVLDVVELGQVSVYSF